MLKQLEQLYRAMHNHHVEWESLDQAVQPSYLNSNNIGNTQSQCRILTTCLGKFICTFKEFYNSLSINDEGEPRLPVSGMPG